MLLADVLEHAPVHRQRAKGFEAFFERLFACLLIGYVELTDAAEQAQRVELDIAERRHRGLRTHPVDTLLLQALQSGLPPCAGVAMGFERLQMIHDGTDDIGDVLTFEFEADS